MPVIWLQRREPMHDLYILVGHIEGVGNIVYVAAVGVGVAEADRLYI